MGMSHHENTDLLSVQRGQPLMAWVVSLKSTASLIYGPATNRDSADGLVVNEQGQLTYMGWTASRHRR